MTTAYNPYNLQNLLQPQQTQQPQQPQQTQQPPSGGVLPTLPPVRNTTLPGSSSGSTPPTTPPSPYNPYPNPRQLTQPTTQPRNAPQDLFRSLFDRFFQQQQPQQFNFQGQPVNIPQYQPGANPFAFQTQQINAPQPGQIPGFDARYQAVAGPQVQRAGQFNPQQNPLQQQVLSSLMGGLQNPSAYNSDVVGQTYDMLNRRLGQGFDVERQRINEEMARRGIFSSTIAGGRLGDLASRQAEAQSDLATNLLNQQAQRFGQDRQAAIAQALGYGGMDFGNQLASYQANLAGSGQNFQQDLASRAFAGDQQAMEVLNSLQRAQFGQGAQAQQFAQGLAGAQFGQSEQNRLLDSMLANLGFNQGLAQQGFQNQLATGQFQQGLNNQNFAQALAGQQQNQSQYQQALQNFLGYQGQQFGQDLSTAQFNQQGDIMNQQFLLDLYSRLPGGA